MQGFRDKYHKDESHKLNKYWSNQHESGKYDKYGQHGEHYHSHDGKSNKGGSHAVSRPICISAPNTYISSPFFIWDSPASLRPLVLVFRVHNAQDDNWDKY